MNSKPPVTYTTHPLCLEPLRDTKRSLGHEIRWNVTLWSAHVTVHTYLLGTLQFFISCKISIVIEVLSYLFLICFKRWLLYKLRAQITIILFSLKNTYPYLYKGCLQCICLFVYSGYCFCVLLIQWIPTYPMAVFLLLVNKEIYVETTQFFRYVKLYIRSFLIIFPEFVSIL